MIKQKERLRRRIKAAVCSILAAACIIPATVFSVSAGGGADSPDCAVITSISTSPIGSPDYEEEHDFKVTANYFARRTEYSYYTYESHSCSTCGGSGGSGSGSGDEDGGGSGSGHGKPIVRKEKTFCGQGGWKCRPACDGTDYKITWPNGNEGTGTVTRNPDGTISENWHGATIGGASHPCDCYKEEDKVVGYENDGSDSGDEDGGGGGWTDCPDCGGSGSITVAVKHPPKEPPSQVTFLSYVWLEGKIVAAQTITISLSTTLHTDDIWVKEGTATVDWIINAEEDIGEKEVKVTIGDGGTDDNEKTTVIDVKPACNLTVKYVDPHSRYTTTTTVISTFLIENHDTNLGLNVRPKHDLTVTFRAYDKQDRLLHTQTKKGVVVPANRSNIVYFEWNLPALEYSPGYLLTNLRLECDINVDYRRNTHGVNEDDYTDNSVSITQGALSGYTAETYNPKREEKPPDQVEKSQYIQNRDYGGAWRSITDKPTAELSWSQWLWNGGYQLKEYSAKLNTETVNGLDPTIQSTEELNKEYGLPMPRMRSGYGVTTKVQGWLTLDGSPEKNAYTVPQSVNMYFPEFNYGFGLCDWLSRQWDYDSEYVSSLHRSLEWTEETDNLQTFQYYQNRFSVTRGENDELVHNNLRVHYTPLWFPDTNPEYRYREPGYGVENPPYQPVPLIYNAWTPVGMLSCYDTAANGIEITGTLYDDWYTSYK